MGVSNLGLVAKDSCGGDFAHAYIIAREVGPHVQTLTGASGKLDRIRQSGGNIQGETGPRQTSPPTSWIYDRNRTPSTPAISYSSLPRVREESIYTCWASLSTLEN